jgi:hypothetical protein
MRVIRSMLGVPQKRGPQAKLGRTEVQGGSAGAGFAQCTSFAPISPPVGVFPNLILLYQWLC